MARHQWCIVCDDKKGGCGGTNAITRKAGVSVQLITCEYCDRPMHVTFPDVTRNLTPSQLREKKGHKVRSGRKVPTELHAERAPVWRAVVLDDVPIPSQE